MTSFRAERELMVTNQIAARGISDEKVLEAMRKVPRHLFVPEEAHRYAYSDSPVRIGSGQTISQPYIVALMTALLQVESQHRVLDVGTGSGYQAAILAEIASQVYSVERHAALAEEAEGRLQALGYDNVSVHVGDGTRGLAEYAPFDRIVVAAAAPKVPKALVEQLAEGGRLVIPVGERFSQHLEVWERSGGELNKHSGIPVVFVPLVGENGWD